MAAQHHYIDIADAVKYGMAASAILGNIVFWLREKQAAGEDFYDGRTWVYYTYDALAERYPYLTREQCKYAIEKLLSAGVLTKADYSRERFRRPTYYALTDREIHRLEKIVRSSGENSPNESGKSHDRVGHSPH